MKLLLCVRSWESCTTSRDCYLAITLVLHKHTHMLFHSYSLPSLRVAYASWKAKDLDPHTLTTLTLRAPCLIFVSSSLCPVQVLYQHTPFTCENSICLKKHFPQLHTERNWTICRIPSKQKSIWQLSHGDNEPMNLKSSIRVENCSCTWYLQVLASEIL